MGRTLTSLYTERITMKNIFLLSILTLAILQPLAEAIFLGPIAVGVALGAIAVGKGLILGSILSQRRTSHRSARSYTRYNRRSHYSQPRTYYKHYTQPKTYYYSSSKKENGEVLTEVEEEIIGVFGKGRAVDTSKSTAIFDFAAQAGKYWKKGGYGCEFFARCDTPTSDIVAMIENELEDFRKLEESFLNDPSRAESVMEEETNEVQDMINSL